MFSTYERIQEGKKEKAIQHLVGEARAEDSVQANKMYPDIITMSGVINLFLLPHKSLLAIP